MPKVRNIQFINKKVGISTELVQFDSNGIGEIKCKKIYDSVLGLPNFFAIEEDKDVAIEVPIEEEVAKEEPVKQEEPKEEPKVAPKKTTVKKVAKK